MADERKTPPPPPSALRPRPPRPSAPPSSRSRLENGALVALQNDLHRFEQAQRSQERALWLLYIEGPGVAPFCERLLRRRLVIGRDAGCSLPLLGEAMAPQHALLEHDDGGDHWCVMPLSNGHPTFVNGKRVHARTPLGPEDRVQVGPWLLRIGVEGDDEWHQKLRFATLHSPPSVPGIAKGGSSKPDRLIVLSGPVPAKEIRLDEGPVRLGPVKGSSLVPEPGALVDLNVEVSPTPDGRYELICYGDEAQVSVNGVVERRVLLTPGDRLRLGSGSAAAYLVFAARVPGPESTPGSRTPVEVSRVRARTPSLALPSAAALNAPAPESEAVWSLQAMGLEGAGARGPWLEPPKWDEARPSDEAPRPSEPPPAPEQRVSRLTAMLVVATALLLGLFALGVTSLLRGRRAEGGPMAEAGASEQKPERQGLRPAAEGAREATPASKQGAAMVAAADEPAGEPAADPAPAESPAAERPLAGAAPEAKPDAPEAKPAAPEAKPDAPEPAPMRAVAAMRAEPPAARLAPAPPRPEAAPRPAPPSPKPALAPEPSRAPARPAAPKEAPRPREASGGEASALCERLRALQRSGRATPDDERMLRRCH